MNAMKQALLATYYYGSLPFRQWSNAQAARAGNAPVMVLFYHRVADDRPNDWTLSTKQFERQLNWLLPRFDLVSLEEAQARIRAGANARPAVSITFDDGYADNCRFALPLLIRHRVPCTYFVSVHNVSTGKPFPHDAAEAQPPRPNSIDELKTLADHNVEIGSHTRNHVDLGRVADPARIHDEVVAAGHDLAKLLGRPVRYFAFPYGLRENLNRQAFDLAQEAGYVGVCSAYGGYNFPGDDAFHLRRIHGDSQWVRWKNWLAVDPRKVRGRQRGER
ncbi:MAG: polysaccharide deacetylase family protein [Planctomycetes bacterium]|nr:polysaccharide deacetylase family protein [Planctomycetota bacterium]